MTTTDFPALVYVPDPFGVRAAPFWLVRPGHDGQRLGLDEVAALTGPVVTYELPSLVDELRRAGRLVPSEAFDIGDALRLIVGHPKDETGDGRWDVWRHLARASSEPKTVKRFEAIYKSRATWPEGEELDGLLSGLGSDLLKLWERTAEQLKLGGEWVRFSNVETLVQNIFAARQRAGIAVNQDVAEELLGAVTEEKYRSFAAVAQAIGASPTGLNFWRIGPYLNRTDAADLAGETDGGRLREAFKLAAHRSSFAKDFLSLIDSTHDEAVLRRAMGFEGRLHPTFSVLGTVSGRILVSDPHLQQLRRRYRGVIAADPGKRLVYLDYAQFEPGVLAHLCGDQKLIAAYCNGDLYTGLAEAVFGDRAARPLAKRMFLAFCYGMTAASVARLVATPGDDERRAFYAGQVEAFFQAFPGLTSYRHEMQRLLVRDGYVATLEGNRRRREHNGELTSKERRWAVNQPIQGTAALIFKEALIRLSAEFGSDAILLPVHDAVLLQFDDDESFDTSVTLAVEIMQQTFERRCPGISARVTVGGFSD